MARIEPEDAYEEWLSQQHFEEEQRKRVLEKCGTFSAVLPKTEKPDEDPALPTL